MVIKTVRMGHSDPGVAVGLHRLGRGARPQGASHADRPRPRASASWRSPARTRIVFDQDLAYVEEESSKHRRKAAVHDD